MNELCIRMNFGGRLSQKLEAWWRLYKLVIANALVLEKKLCLFSLSVDLSFTRLEDSLNQH